MDVAIVLRLHFRRAGIPTTVNQGYASAVRLISKIYLYFGGKLWRSARIEAEDNTPVWLPDLDNPPLRPAAIYQDFIETPTDPPFEHTAKRVFSPN